MNDTTHDLEHLRQRRRLREQTRRVTWVLVASMLGIMAAMLLTSGPAPAATCKERCQLNRAITATCPSTRHMTRPHCIRWIEVAQCEAGGQQRSVTLRSIRQIGWRTNKAYDGGLQFSVRTWRGNIGRVAARKLTRRERLHRNAGRYRFAYGAPARVQILAAEVLRLRLGGNPHQSAGWPSCGARFYG